MLRTNARKLPAAALLALLVTACADDVSVGGEGETDSSSTTTDDLGDGSSGQPLMLLQQHQHRDETFGSHIPDSVAQSRQKMS